MRVIPLIIPEKTLQAAEAAAGDAPLLELKPWVRRTAAIVSTGSEVKKGLIQDTFTPVVKEKLAAYGIGAISVAYSGDGVENVASAVREARGTGADVILCTGGMSVDPDDNTPGGIQASGAKIVAYGAPCCPAPGSCWAITGTAPQSWVCPAASCTPEPPSLILSCPLWRRMYR